MATARKPRVQRDSNEAVSDDYVSSPSVPDPAGARIADMAPFIWQQLSDIQKALGGIEAKQTGITDRLQRVEDRTGKLSDRIGRLMWGIAGAGILVTVMFGVARLFPIKISLEETTHGEVSTAAKPGPVPALPTK